MWVLETKLAISKDGMKMTSTQNKAGKQINRFPPHLLVEASGLGIPTRKQMFFSFAQDPSPMYPNTNCKCWFTAFWRILISVYLADLFPLYKTSSITILKHEIILFKKTSLTVVVFVHWHYLHLASCLCCGRNWVQAPPTHLSPLDKATWTEL